MKSIVDIDLDKVNLSEFQDEIEKLKQEFNNIKRNKRLMKILNSYKKKIRNKK